MKFKGGESAAKPPVAEPSLDRRSEDRGDPDEALVRCGLIPVHGQVSVLAAGIPFARYQ